MQVGQFWLITTDTLKGPWHVASWNDAWWIVNKDTGENRRIGRVGGPQGDGTGHNFFDEAKAEAKRLNGEE